MERSEMLRYVFQLGALPFIVLGFLHTVYSLADVINPRRITPRNDQVRILMSETTLRLTNRSTMWLAWLGFNISHGIGALFFGLIFILIAQYDFKIILAIKPLMLLAVFMSASYLALAVKFWFYIPIIGCAIGFICFLLCYIMT